MSNTPKISIVTPCYNSVNFIHRLHKSLCAQSYKNFEWVLVDDCSTDNTLEVLENLTAPGSAGISVYRLPQNSGGGVALGFAIEKCRGEIAVMIDHDDELVEEALAVLMSEWPLIANRPEIAGIFYRVIDPESVEPIGDELRLGTEFSHSWLVNSKPSISDGMHALRASIAKKYFSPLALEPICLNGVPLNAMTKKYKLIAGASRPLQFYHRDNPSSMTNLVKISRKTVYTYAKLIDGYDINYLRRPLHWAFHLIRLIRYSIEVHRTPLFHHRYIESRLIIAFSFCLIPLGVLRYYFLRGKLEVIDLPEYPLGKLVALRNCHS